MSNLHTQLSYRRAGDLLLAMRAKLNEKAAR